MPPPTEEGAREEREEEEADAEAAAQGDAPPEEEKEEMEEMDQLPEGAQAAEAGEEEEGEGEGEEEREPEAAPFSAPRQYEEQQVYISHVSPHLPISPSLPISAHISPGLRGCGGQDQRLAAAGSSRATAGGEHRPIPLHTSLCLPMSPCISPYLSRSRARRPSPYISPRLRTPAHISAGGEHH